MFDWCVVRCGSKNKHFKDASSKKFRLCLRISILAPYSIVNIIGRTYVFSDGLNKHTLSITIFN